MIKVNHLEIIGKKFERLTVKEFLGNKIRYTKGRVPIRNESYYLCVCDCGVSKEVKRDLLLAKGRNKAISCGCKTKEDGEIRKRSNVDPDMSVKGLYFTYMYSARKRGISFDISLEEFKYLTQQNCYLCDDKPSSIKKAPNNNRYAPDYIYNGVDRIDSDKEYTLDNCKACCKNCNYSKHTLGLAEYINHIQKVLSNLEVSVELKQLLE